MARATWKKTEAEGVYINPQTQAFKITATVVETGTGRRIARRRCLQGVRTIEEAKEHRNALIRQLQVEIRPESRAEPTITVASYVVNWMKEKDKRVRPAVAERYRQALASKILPAFGHLEPDEVTRAQVSAWVSGLEEAVFVRNGEERAYAKDTLMGWWRVAKMLLKDMAADLMLPDSTARVRAPRSERRNVTARETLTPTELRALIDGVARWFPVWVPEVLMMTMTGMRPSELYALHWDDFDFELALVRVQRSVDQKKRVELTKTGDPREPALTPEMMVVLSEHRESLRARGLPTLGSSIAFPTKDGEYRGRSALAKVLRLSGAGVGLGKRIGPKTLRRTFVSLAVARGSDRLALKSNVGHVDEEMVERYFWATLEERRKLATELQAELRGVTGRGNTSRGGVTSAGKADGDSTGGAKLKASTGVEAEGCYQECYLDSAGNTDSEVTPRVSE